MVNFLWVPAYYGVKRNEMAYKSAKGATGKILVEPRISFSKTEIKY